MMTKNSNSKALADFVAYCHSHPTERFWQALRNWSGHNFVYVSDQFIPYGECGEELDDTFYFKGKTKEE